MTEPGLTFWAFVAERWGRLLVFAVAWAIAVFWLIPRLPPFVGNLIYSGVYAYLFYRLGFNIARKRHSEDIDRFTKFVRAAEDYVAFLEASLERQSETDVH